jgi:hypothetical protein
MTDTLEHRVGVELEESLDAVLGPETTTYQLRGRMFGMLIDLEVDPLHFARRMLADCIAQAMPETWIHRAAAFADAAPRPGDYPGQATLTELCVARRRCLDDAQRCLQHAELLAELAG